MAMINDTRFLIQDRLNAIKTEYGIKEISYRIAKNDKLWPHIVYDFTDISPTDMGRSDFTLDIHIWGKDQENCFDIMDAVRDLLTFWNYPTQSVLPTFYEMSGGSIEDPDKSIVHLVLMYQVQVFETDATDARILRKE